MTYKRIKFWTDGKVKNLSEKLQRFFDCVFIYLNHIMAESWLKYPQEELLTSGFDYTSQTNAQNLAILNYDAIQSEQIDDINYAESFASPDVSTPSDSSEEETQWRPVVEQLELEMKTLKKKYV